MSAKERILAAIRELSGRQEEEGIVQKGHVAFTIGYLCKVTGYSDPTVSKYIGELIKEGVLVLKKRFYSGISLGEYRRPSVYLVREIDMGKSSAPEVITIEEQDRAIMRVLSEAVRMNMEWCRSVFEQLSFAPKLKNVEYVKTLEEENARLKKEVEAYKRYFLENDELEELKIRLEKALNSYQELPAWKREVVLPAFFGAIREIFERFTDIFTDKEEKGGD